MTKTATKLLTWLVGISFGASLVFNGLWIALGNDLRLIECTVHFTEVYGDALEAKANRDWTRAAHLFAYLRDYHPYSEKGCRFSRQEESASAGLVLALVQRIRPTSAADDSALQRKIDNEHFRDEYTKAAFEAGLAKDAREAIRNSTTGAPSDVASVRVQ